jgi:glycosyltransferase involved in cell wall biosynthesis
MTTSEVSATPHVPGAHRQRGVRHAANLARQSLHIGLLAPPWISIPPPTYGGIEQVVELLGRGLARRGHRVTIVAAPGSRIDGVEVITPLREPPAQIGLMPDDLLHCLAGVEALDKLGDVDVIIDHSGPMGGLLAARSGIPTLHVLHGPLTRPISAVYSAIVHHAPSLGLVAISEAQRRSAHEFPIAGVCHNGIDVTSAPFRDHDEGYLAFLGRMSPDKGAAEAIAVARAARRPILLAAKCREPHEKE